MSSRLTPLSELPGFIPLPANPADLTDEQCRALFDRDVVNDFIRTLVTFATQQHDQPNMPTISAQAKSAVNHA